MNNNDSNISIMTYLCSNFVRYCRILLLPLVFVACANGSKINNPTEVVILKSSSQGSPNHIIDVIAASFGSSASLITLLFADGKLPKEVRITNRRRSDLTHEVSKVEIVGCKNSDEIIAAFIEEGTIIGEILLVSVGSQSPNSEICLLEHLSINIATEDNPIDDEEPTDTLRHKSAIIRTYHLSFNNSGNLAIEHDPLNIQILE
ncbi:MAG: hypothetical protein FD128_2378 [Hyphomonadaceae bacterium]|nr:MAG: hypothetical protein FD128_2378 [Hyphomonadaceae bacterium]